MNRCCLSSLAGYRWPGAAPLPVRAGAFELESTVTESAIVDQAVAAAEIHWSVPYGNPLSKYGCSQMASVLGKSDPVGLG